MRVSIQRERLVATIIFVTPLLIVCWFLVLRLVDFHRYDTAMRDDRLLENLQAGLFFAAGVVALRISARFFNGRAHGRSALFLVCAGIMTFVALEEISWGQRLLSFTSSDYFRMYNIQGETNVHNLTLFQPYVHGAYIAAGSVLAILCLAPGARLRDRFWFLIPRRRLVLYFLPVVVFYSWFEWNRLIRGTYIYAHDQELCETVFALGVLLFALQILLEQSDRRIDSPA